VIDGCSLIAPVDAHVDTCGLHAPPRPGIAVERKRDARRQREHVGPVGGELLVGDLDRRDPALLQELHEPNGEQRWVDDREIIGERRDHGHQVQELGPPPVVRQVVCDHVDLGERLTQRGGARLVRPVAETDEQRPLVEPAGVAPVHGRRSLDPRRGGHAGPLQRSAERFDFAEARLLARPKQESAVAHDEPRVVWVEAVETGLGRRLGDDDLRPRRFELRPERLVLAGQPPWLGSRAPPGLAPARGFLGARRDDEDAPQPRGHALSAVGPVEHLLGGHAASSAVRIFSMAPASPAPTPLAASATDSATSSTKLR
jgi:hypothetical protein